MVINKFVYLGFWKPLEFRRPVPSTEPQKDDNYRVDYGEEDKPLN